MAENPFQESLCLQLMLALYRSGRTAEALSVYRDTRRKLARELGLEPSEKLRVMERLILDRRPAGELSPGIAPGLPMPARAAATGPQDRIALLEREIADLRDASVRPG
ncbi:BTAD domain-containing putative transcriptional regulator [Streptomyces anulatus]|uniref:BTAD domain-containing putative transcriptional regulator n=1 Tax=Streptomyces anulatus TaxID=1892 RepID=UPI0036C8DB6B